MLQLRAARRPGAIVAATLTCLVTVGAGTATAAPYECISPLTIFKPDPAGPGGQKGHELIDNLQLAVGRTGAPLTATPGQPLTLNGVQLKLDYDDDVFLKDLWASGLVRHRGVNTFPLWTYVALRASNTVEGVQLVTVRSTYDFVVADPTPGTFGTPPTDSSPGAPQDLTPRTSGDEIVQPISATVALSDTTWTPTGAGPVEFTVGNPGDLGVIRVVGRYDDRQPDAHQWTRVRPFGPIYVRAETNSSENLNYAISNDCVRGTIALTPAALLPASDPAAIPHNAGGQRRAFFGDGSPFEPNWDLGREDSQPGDRDYAPRGVRGRYAISAQPEPAFASAALAAAPAPTPTPTPTATPTSSTRPLSLTTSSVKVSRGAIALRVRNASAETVAARIGARTPSRVRVTTRSSRIVTVFATRDLWVRGGTTRTVRIELSENARRALRLRSSIRVRVTLTVGSQAVNRTITVRR